MILSENIWLVLCNTNSYETCSTLCSLPIIELTRQTTGLCLCVFCTCPWFSDQLVSLSGTWSLSYSNILKHVCVGGVALTLITQHMRMRDRARQKVGFIPQQRAATIQIIIISLCIDASAIFL